MLGSLTYSIQTRLLIRRPYIIYIIYDKFDWCYFPSPSICSKHRLQAKHESLQNIHTVELPIQMPSHIFRQHVQVRFVQRAQFVVALQQLRQHSLHPFGSLRSIFCATGAWTATTFIAIGSLGFSIILWKNTKNTTDKMKINTNRCYIPSYVDFRIRVS